MEAILDQMQDALTKSIESLSTIERKGLLEKFNINSAIYINRATNGFILLKKDKQHNTARLLIRPAMEVMFKLRALRSEPSILYRIAYSEFLEDRKWSKTFNSHGKDEFDKNFEDIWIAIEDSYKNEFPQHHLVKKELKILETAQVSNMEIWYTSNYRLYCRYAHGALRALVDDLECFDAEDSRTMAACIFAAIEAVVQSGGVCSDLEELMQKFNNNFAESYTKDAKSFQT